MLRSPDLRRSLLFVAGAEADAQASALQARPDVLIQDLEDSTPPQLRETGRQCAAGLYAEARRRGVMPAVRINPLDSEGKTDLAAVVPARPELVLLPKATSGVQIAALAAELERLEVMHGLPCGAIEIVPTIETAAGVVYLADIVRGSARVKSCLLGTEDLAADLVAERGSDSQELAYARARFLLEARALAIEPIDHPYTYSDLAGCEAESRRGRRLGYRSKSAVGAAHIAVIHRIFTPDDDEVAAARKVVQAFEAASAAGKDRPLVDGLWVEPPAYFNARRLLERSHQLAGAAGQGTR